jgi:hypothetical protein
MIAFLAWACSQGREAVKTSAALVPESQDSTIYELVINDIHFDNWYLLNYSDAKDRTEEYYHSKNLIAVSNWNYIYRMGQHYDVIDSYINYEPQLDYGIEVNRRLYWYFAFVEDYYDVKLFW